MNNIATKLTLAVVSVMSLTSLAVAGIAPTQLPEPGAFGLFAGAVAVALIMARIIKK